MQILPVVSCSFGNNNNLCTKYKKPFAETEIKTTSLPAFADAKSLANINFKAAIHDYAMNGDLEGIKKELEKGVDVNIQDKAGWAPLHMACQEGNVDVVKLLCEQEGIDLNIQNKWGDTPLHRACYNEHTDIVKLLCKQKEIDLNIQNNHQGWTPLHVACDTGALDVIQYLCTLDGINMNIKGYWKWHYTPLQSVYNNRNFYVLNLLCDQDGIDFTIEDDLGNTVLDRARRDGFRDKAWYKKLENRTRYQEAHPETIGKSKPLTKKEEKEEEQKQAEQTVQAKMDELTKEQPKAEQSVQVKMDELDAEKQALDELMNNVAQEVAIAQSGFRALYGIQGESIENLGYPEQLVLVTEKLLENKNKLQNTNENTPDDVTKALRNKDGQISNESITFMDRILQSSSKIDAGDLLDSINAVKNETGFIDLGKAALFISTLAWGTAIKKVIEKVKNMPKIK